ncbi:hypothetical protein B0H14DRAFT_2358506 [Mycena olivaceomarginata]|nr:hypothetical protein B0H14DRAFT_2358506 [Mycena olivaceomarginata]
MTTTINPNSNESKLTVENFEILRCHDSQLQMDFEFSDSPDLNGLMLDQQGINPDGSIEMCEGCLSRLHQSELPKFDLKNDLSRGRVPEEFSDLTWIEEMVCCVYRTTAHVIRLFNSNNEKQPKVFHGNVCAHEMNIVSTATVLPRTPQDINGCISVVFIGPDKFKADAICKLFSIRRDKVWAFLCWLKFTARNPLYADVPLSKDNLLQVLPGIHDRIIHDDKATLVRYLKRSLLLNERDGEES